MNPQWENLTSDLKDLKDWMSLRPQTDSSEPSRSAENKEDDEVKEDDEGRGGG